MQRNLLESMCDAGVLEMPGERFYQIIWEQFDLLDLMKWARSSMLPNLSIRSMSLLAGESLQDGDCQVGSDNNNFPLEEGMFSGSINKTLVHTSRKDMLWVLSVKEFQEKSLLCHASHLLEHCARKVKSEPNLMAFQSCYRLCLGPL